MDSNIQKTIAGGLKSYVANACLVSGYTLLQLRADSYHTKRRVLREKNSHRFIALLNNKIYKACFVSHKYYCTHAMCDSVVYNIESELN